MASETLFSTLKQETKKAYGILFDKDWPAWIAGILIAVLALLVFLWSDPWAIASGYRNWGDWLFYGLGVIEKKPVVPWLHPISMSNFGIFLGALMSALMSRQFMVRQAPRFEYLKGLVGGLLMGVGAAFAKGCNAGGFYSAIGTLSLGGFAMMFGLGAGAWLGLKYLLWEMENITIKPLTPKERNGPFLGVNWDKVQPYIGVLLILAIIALFYLYASINDAPLGGLVFFTFLIGFVMHRSRFCFVRAFRCPFMTGEAEMVKVVAMSLMIYGLGSAALKWADVLEPLAGVRHPFFLGSLGGGLIFGVGMILAGGCASSTLWRMGEGHLKLVNTAVGFSIANSLTVSFLVTYKLDDKLGKAVFLPDVFTWYLVAPLFILFFVSWIILAAWNEKTEKFVLF